MVWLEAFKVFFSLLISLFPSANTKSPAWLVRMGGLSCGQSAPESGSTEQRGVAGGGAALPGQEANRLSRAASSIATQLLLVHYTTDKENWMSIVGLNPQINFFYVLSTSF